MTKKTAKKIYERKILNALSFLGSSSQSLYKSFVFVLPKFVFLFNLKDK